MTDVTLSHLVARIDDLTAAVKLLAAANGTRLTQAQLCARLGMHRNTLAKLRTRPDFPTPDVTGKWLLSEVIEWEARRPN